MEYLISTSPPQKSARRTFGDNSWEIYLTGKIENCWMVIFAFHCSASILSPLVGKCLVMFRASSLSIKDHQCQKASNFLKSRNIRPFPHPPKKKTKIFLKCFPLCWFSHTSQKILSRVYKPTRYTDFPIENTNFDYITTLTLMRPCARKTGEEEKRTSPQRKITAATVRLSVLIIKRLSKFLALQMI